MDPFQYINLPDFGPAGLGPGSGSGNRDAGQTVIPPQQAIASVAQESRSAKTLSRTILSMDSAPTDNPNQPPVGASSSTDVLKNPASAGGLSVGAASIAASTGSSSTSVGFQSPSPVSTLLNSASTPVSTLLNSAAGGPGSGPSTTTRIVDTSTTTVTGLSNASASAAKAADGTEGLTSATPERVLKNQTTIGVAVGIAIWLLIIAVLSFCLWRKRKLARARVQRFNDDSATLMPRNMSQADVETIMGMAPTKPAQTGDVVPKLPPPAFLTHRISTMDNVSGPLGSHPVSREGRASHDGVSSLSVFEYENLGRRLSAPPRTLSLLFPGAHRISHHPSMTDTSTPTPTPPNDLSSVKTRAISLVSVPDKSTPPAPIAALLPSQSKMNSRFEEGRRRSRLTASSSGMIMDFHHNRDMDSHRTEEAHGEEDEEVGRRRADSGTLGAPIMSFRAGPASRPISLASLKDVYRRSATLERSFAGERRIQERSK